MIEVPFFAAEMTFSLVWIFIRIFIWLCHKKINWKRESELLLMYLNLFFLIRLIFFPLSHIAGKIPPVTVNFRSNVRLRLNVVPFVHILRFGTKRDLILNLAGNIIMFIPSGILFPTLYKRINSFWKTLFAGFLLSLCFEILQLPVITRATDIDDVILNTFGCALGYAVYKILASLKRDSKSPCDF